MTRQIHPRPEVGDVINGWRVLREEGRAEGSRADLRYLVACPGCGGKYVRPASACRNATRCVLCLNGERRRAAEEQRRPPAEGALINGWRVLGQGERDKDRNRLWRVICPTCGAEAQRRAGDLRRTSHCPGCAISGPRPGSVYRSHTPSAPRVVVRECCTDRRCTVCAGTNRKVDLVKKEDK